MPFCKMGRTFEFSATCHQILACKMEMMKDWPRLAIVKRRETSQKHIVIYSGKYSVKVSIKPYTDQCNIMNCADENLTIHAELQYLSRIFWVYLNYSVYMHGGQIGPVRVFIMLRVGKLFPQIKSQIDGQRTFLVVTDTICLHLA